MHPRAGALPETMTFGEVGVTSFSRDFYGRENSWSFSKIAVQIFTAGTSEMAKLIRFFGE